MASDINILSIAWPTQVWGKIRYRKKEAPCRAVIRDGHLWVTFEEEQEAITPGQSVVLYDSETVLGGGVIEKVIGGAYSDDCTT